jgi:spore germination cell wall hydrolase CwlJ-like protein
VTELRLRPWHDSKPARPFRREPFRLTALVLATGSCTTMQVAAVEAPQEFASAQVTMEIPEGVTLPASPAELADPTAAPLLFGDTAFAANQALPLIGPGSAAPATAFLASATPVAQLRAHDCLTQAIYYEAGNQSEDGQRAVAQVVLNRVRHPSWPNSVCGVVYQGAMRPGGGCQFTFTCDGALARRPNPAMWARARAYATEALAGRVYAPVGLSTFYHANYVMPRWAPRLVKTAVIGAHIFYRLPGAGGAPGAFTDRYAGAEPIARPNPTTVRYGANGAATITAPEWLATPAVAAGVEVASAPVRPAPSPSLVLEPVEVENSQVRPEYRSSGQWRSDAPAALTGR